MNAARLRPTDDLDPITCPVCDGTGTSDGALVPLGDACPWCDGRGTCCPWCGASLSRTGVQPGTDVSAPTCSEGCGWEGTP